MTQIVKLRNAAIYLEGTGYVGAASEIELPSLTYVMEDHDGLGMLGRIETPQGLDKMEGSITWNTWQERAYASMLDGSGMKLLQIRAQLTNFSAGSQFILGGYQASMRVFFKEIPLGGTIQQQQGSTPQTAFAVHACRLVTDGREVLNYDPMANILRVNGRDLAARQNSIMGVR